MKVLISRSQKRVCDLNLSLGSVENCVLREFHPLSRRCQRQVNFGFAGEDGSSYLYRWPHRPQQEKQMNKDGSSYPYKWPQQPHEEKQMVAGQATEQKKSLEDMQYYAQYVGMTVTSDFFLSVPCAKPHSGIKKGLGHISVVSTLKRISITVSNLL